MINDRIRDLTIGLEDESRNPNAVIQNIDPKKHSFEVDKLESARIRK
jgi:hypothetical protein